jgi:HD-GYP domain-containing protein (c-di-GMP phosphodiesterase class II)
MVNPLDFLKFSKKKPATAGDIAEPATVAPEEPAGPAAEEPVETAAEAPEEEAVELAAEVPEELAEREPVAAQPPVAPQPPLVVEPPGAAQSPGAADPPAAARPPRPTAPAKSPGTAAAPAVQRRRASAAVAEVSLDPGGELVAEELYASALQVVGRFFKAAAKLDTEAPETMPIAEIEALAGRLVPALAAGEGDWLVAKAVGPYPDNLRFIVPHSVNVMILAQRVGRQLGLEDPELQILAVSALLHDVGTVRIDKETFYKADSLTKNEWEQMRQRPTHSFDIISTLGPRYRAVAEISHQVHERLDGKGYPRGLKIEDIALEASILGAVDIFEAFIHPRPYKKTVPAAAMYGVDNLMRLSHQFGDGVLKALVRSVGLFPVGTHVKLNSGEVARVLKGRPANPMRPQVEVVFDTQRRRLSTTRLIDLMATPHLYVFKPMSPEDLAELGLI